MLCEYTDPCLSFPFRHPTRDCCVNTLTPVSPLCLDTLHADAMFYTDWLVCLSCLDILHANAMFYTDTCFSFVFLNVNVKALTLFCLSCLDTLCVNATDSCLLHLGYFARFPQVFDTHPSLSTNILEILTGITIFYTHLSGLTGWDAWDPNVLH